MKSLLGTGFSRLKRHLSGKEGPDETGGRLFYVPLSSATEMHCRLETPQENQKQSREESGSLPAHTAILVLYGQAVLSWQ